MEASKINLKLQKKLLSGFAIFDEISVIFVYMNQIPLRCYNENS